MENHEQESNQLIPEEDQKKKRGAPFGNTNALKHGLYVHHRQIRNTSPIEKAALYDLTDHINSLKVYLQHLFELGSKATELEVANDTLRALAVGCNALTRLISLHEINSGIPLSDDLIGVNYYDPNYRSEDYVDPSFAEIEAKLKALGA